MSIDYRASQIQFNKLIASGSTGTGALALIYPINAQDSTNPNQGIINPSVFPTNSIGTDIFLFISGGIGSKDVGGSHGVTVFGGDVFISGSITISGSSTGGGSNTIGDAEDGSYSDGLFTDFTTTTPIGTAVDRFNEVLKAILGIGPAPSLDYLGVADTGVAGALSFGPANAIATYTNVSSTGSQAAVDVNGTYSVNPLSTNLRRGIIDNGIVINGILNDDVVASGSSYPADSFTDANNGVLFLEKNGTEILSINLETAETALTASTANGSTLKVSPTASPVYNGLPFTSFKYRTGTYDIAAADQNNGWNVIKVIHQTVSGSVVSNVVTNYVEWVIDDDNTAITAGNTSLDTLSLTGLTYLTGIKYYTAGSATYKTEISHAYKNTYSTSAAAISFGGSNLTISSQAIPALAGGETQNKVIPVTGSATINASTLLSGTITANVSVAHPITADQLSGGGSASIFGILLYALSPAATVLTEDFRGETYRLSGSNNFSTQADVTDVINYWSSSLDRNSTEDLIVYNDTLVGKASLINGGDFSTITNGPVSNVNYSTFAGSGSYVRYFQNNTGGSKSNFNLTLAGATATIVTSSAGISSDNILVETKLPGQTGWCVLRAFGTGPIITSDGGGILNGTFDNSVPATNACTFGSLTVANNEYIVIRITADHSWAGNLTSMTVAWTT